MKRLTLPLAMLLLMLAACQQGQVNHPVPSVAQIGADLNCPTGDHGFEDLGTGWGFCYPKTWRYQERVQPNPTHLDITLNITDVPCVLSSPVAGASPRQVCSSDAGRFAYMIISTYVRGNATDLASWMQANLAAPLPDRQAIQWGNATEAGRLSDGRRIALTTTQVVILDLRSGFGQLDVEAAMSARLNTWQFKF
jgi:hypothetical protein